MPRIVVAGDINPWGINAPAFSSGDAHVILGDLLPEFERADLIAANLEAPLVDRPSPILKSGPVLNVPEDCVNGLNSMGVDVVGLANNHTMDHGHDGLQSTLAACANAGMTCVGAGSNLGEASIIAVKNAGGVRVGVMALAEHEFGVATRTQSGVCPLDPVVFSRAIMTQKDEYDVLIVLIHGGNEFYRYPRPSLQQVCRYLAELGATAVVCQHSHVVGCYEEYHGSHILYGQGNFICEGNNRPPYWNEGLLVTLDVDINSPAKFRTIPLVQSENGQPGAVRMTGDRLAQFQQDLDARNIEVSDPDVVERRWNEFCLRQRDVYLRRYGALHRAFRLLDKLTGYIRFLLGRPRMRVDHLNMVRCESHREVIINLLDREKPGQ